MKKFKIRISGAKEPIITSWVNGLAVSRSWSDNNIPESTIFSIDNSKIKKSEIKSVIDFDERDEEGDRAESDHIREQMDSEYLKNHCRLRKLSPEEKAKKMEWFKTIYHCFSGLQRAPEELKVDVYKIQLQFFKENPCRIHCDPSLFKELIPTQKYIEFLALNENKRVNGMIGSYSQLIFNTIASDKNASKM